MTDARAAERSARRASRRRQRVAVLVPCYNEEAAIAKVVADFRAALPQATLYVYDNNSTDRTVEAARAAGAVVRRETHQGKGNVVRRMFTDVDADIYVLVDGDATYDAPSAPAMIARLMEERLDMVVAARVHAGRRRLPARPPCRQPAADRLRRPGVRRGLHRHPVRLSGVLAPLRQVVSGAVRRFRDRDRADRACARARAAGGAKSATPYYARPEGSASKLSTWRDGFRILGTILKLYRSERPLRVLFEHRHRAGRRSSIGLAIPIVITFIEYGHRAAAADRDPVDRLMLAASCRSPPG